MSYAPVDDEIGVEWIFAGSLLSNVAVMRLRDRAAQPRAYLADECTTARPWRPTVQKRPLMAR